MSTGEKKPLITLRLILLILVLLLLVIFVAQNNEAVSVTFLFWSLKLTLVLVILLSFILGLVASLFLIWPLSRASGKKSKQITDLEQKIQILEKEVQKKTGEF